MRPDSALHVGKTKQNDKLFLVVPWNIFSIVK